MAVGQKGIGLGSKVRMVRRREGMTQTELAKKLSISSSYLNLIEHERRPLPAHLLLEIARTFQLDLSVFASEEDEGLISDLMQVFGDPLFDGYELTNGDVQGLVREHHYLARAVLALYQGYQSARESVDTIAEQLSGEDDLPGEGHLRLPSEEVSDLIQKHLNYFPDLEEAAEKLWRDAALDPNRLFDRMVGFLEHDLGVSVRLARGAEMRSTVRRYDEGKKEVVLSEMLPPRTRSFQLAHQIGLLTVQDQLDRYVRDPLLTSDTARTICRVALANYYAAAVLMPYERFYEAAKAERYDIEMLGHRFQTSFEQVCHRLTTLRRPGMEGIPFHMIRLDIAGNISKRFSASGIRFARFSGACPRWNVYHSFLTPGMIQTQLSKMPDGTSYFCLARTLPKGRGGYHSPHAMQAIALGCQVEHARDLIYADGVDLEDLNSAAPIGVTCRLCERMDCEQRAFPAVNHRLRVDQNVRGLSFYAPAGP